MKTRGWMPPMASADAVGSWDGTGLLSHVKATQVKCLAPGPWGASLRSDPPTQPLTMQPPSTHCPQEAGSH